MKTKILPLSLLGLVPFALAGQTAVFTDTFENRTAGNQLHGSTSSDGNATWNVSDAGLRSDVTIGSDSGNEFAQSTISSGATLTQFRDTSGDAFEEPDFRLEFDFYYLSDSNDNIDLRFQYRLQNDFDDLDKGGDIPGYRLRLKAFNSTTPDSVDWFIETDPDGSGSNLLGSGSFDVAGLVVSGNTTPGAPLPVALEVVGDNHSLTLDGTNVANLTDSQFGGPGEDEMNFRLNPFRNRGFDDITLTSIPEASAAPAILGAFALGLVATARRRR